MHDRVGFRFVEPGKFLVPIKQRSCAYVSCVTGLQEFEHLAIETLRCSELLLVEHWNLYPATPTEEELHQYDLGCNALHHLHRILYPLHKAEHLQHHPVQ